MAALPKVYLETTIPSFLTARPSNNLVVAGKQEVTRQWWDRRQHHYQLYISELVIQEASRGDPDAAQRRLDAVDKLEIVRADLDARQLAATIMDAGILPPKALTDAAHIAVAARHQMDYLLTWNCRHIANAEIFEKVEMTILKAGFRPPIICIPDELFGGEEIHGG